MNKVEIPTEQGLYLLCTVVDGTTYTSLAKVNDRGQLWSEYLGDRLPPTATFVRIPDTLAHQVRQEARAKFVEQFSETLARSNFWEHETQLLRMHRNDIELFRAIWPAMTEDLKSYLQRKGATS